jgi:soluble lytic murein transglycosylase-like protein
MRILGFALVVCVATAVPVQAQIYAWRDANGNLVLSDTPKAGTAGATYAVPGTILIRTTSKPSSANAANAYDDLIRQHADRHGISADLVRAVIQAESGFNRWAVSPKGAMGLMQLMPATARELGVRDPFHPGENIRGGVTYLAQLLNRFNQDVTLALAAYNAGAERVQRYNGVPPYRETRDYVRKITGATKNAAVRETVIYRWIELVDGVPKVRYSNVPPRDVPYETVGKR